MNEIHEILAVWTAIILAVSMVTRLAGAFVGVKCICTNSSFIDTIVNSAGTFIDILQECKRKRKKIFGIRKLHQFEGILNDIIFVNLKVIKNCKARKCLIKTHLLCACHRPPM